MAEFTLYLGNRNYSSWSLRAWLMAKQSMIDCDDVVIPLFEPGSHDELLRHSPNGLVPVIHHGDLVIWDSLAIGEYLADLYPATGLWPADRIARAVARAAATEMHAGFTALRNHMPMNMRSTYPNRGVTPEVQADINRITALWRDCRRRFGDDGPFLFGHVTITDAMFAPVVSRFRTYRVELDDEAKSYADAVWDWPAFQEWLTAARNEPMIIPRYEF